ncbi:MAG TPA: twin-arginine translocase subunit TatC [Actinomycetota bacterium]|jgi:sec-independent protein translocase protein TatC|nr:twin-arginine translocase subunit TatC [Actinomycetota bacterium]
MAGADDLRRRRARFLRRRGRRERAATMPMVAHLAELRTRLIKSAVAFITISIAVFAFYEPIFSLFQRPLCDIDPDRLGPLGCRLQFARVIGAFQFRLKLTALVGIALSSPVWLYQIWAFVVPALTKRERRYARPFIVIASGLFLAGALFAYVLLPTGLRFLLAVGGENLVPWLGAEEYLNFVGFMLLGFGIMFELPVVLFFAGLLDIVGVDQLRRGRRVALVLIVILAAIVTPSQDPYTMLLLSVPLYLFYELTILLLAATLKRRKEPGV